MISDVEVDIFWADGPFFLDNVTSAVTGITISYAINTIPIARLTVSAAELATAAPELLCNPDKFKKRKNTIHIVIKSKTGCINFRGYFDGLNVIQTPGGFDYSIMVKNQFQPLVEIFPKLMGILPGSIPPLRAGVNFLYQAVAGKTLPFDIAYKSALKAKTISTKEFLSVVAYFFELLRILVEEQQTMSISIVPADGTINSNPALMQLIKTNAYKDTLKLGAEILKKFDLTPVEDCKAKSVGCAPEIVDIAARDQTSLWEMILEACNKMSCAVVVGNNKAWIVPHASFLKFPTAKPLFQELTTGSGLVNTAYPAEYNNFSVSDTSYKSIRACYVSNQGHSFSTVHGNFAASTKNWGCYPDTGDDPKAVPDFPEDGGTGILVLRSDDYLFHIVNGTFVNSEILKNQSKPKESPCSGAPVGKPAAEVPVDNKQATDYAKINEKHAKEVMNAYAKSKFLQAKYQDRTGSFSLMFNPNWVPGSSGSLYSRVPGMCFNFYVDNVTHNIQLSSPHVGSAITQVSFSACRFHGDPAQVPGIDKDPLYNYGLSDMKDFQKAWVSDVTGK